MLSAGLLVQAFAQGPREVSGTVNDNHGDPVIGAVVLVKGTSNGVMTDASGQFSIRVPDESAVLEASCLGYTTVEIAAGRQDRLLITLP